MLDSINDHNQYNVSDLSNEVSMASTPLNFISPRDVPSIPASLNSGNYELVIPSGFDDLIEKHDCDEDGKIVIYFKNPENEMIRDITIPAALFNSEDTGSHVCKFIFEESTSRKGVGYFTNDEDKKLVLNINQVLYMTLHHRLTFLRRYDKKYIGLLATDIKNLTKFIDYVLPNTHNGRLKVKHAYAIVNYFKAQAVLPVGEYIVQSSFTENEWIRILRDLRISISSESSMSKLNKVVILPEGVNYKAVGYKAVTGTDKNYIWSIFPPKQNLPARLKSHVLTDAYPLDNPTPSIFMQDNRVENGVLYPLDNCSKEVLVVFDKMDFESRRFVAGEIEASERVAKTLIHIVENVDVAHFEPEVMLVKGTSVVCAKQGFRIGFDEDREPIVIKAVHKLRVLDITHNGIAGTVTLKLDLTMYAGNARILSNTGIKGVTKVKPNVGFITIDKLVDVAPSKHKEFTPSTWEHVKKQKLLNTVDVPAEQKVESQIYDVDLVMGMNAVKGHSNTIVLAQAAFAVKHGYYVPSIKQGFSGLLNTLDEAEINAAAASVPEFKYIDEFGDEREVFFGIAYIQYTELGALYTTFKPQSFMFESGKNILYNDPKLSAYIWDRYLDKEKVAACEELAKILSDDKAYLAKEDGLPIYSAMTIRQKKIFRNDTLVSDLILKKKSMFELPSKLLDEEWNKGFYIDLSKYGFPVIRIPSAKTLNMFTGTLKDGYTIYHEVLINISKILLHIIGKPADNFNMNVGYIYDKMQKRNTDHSLYMSSIKGILYSSEDSSQMMIQALIKPQVHGVNMKQVVESRLPPNTIVIMDDSRYARLYKIASRSVNDLTNDKEMKDLTVNHDFMQDVINSETTDTLLDTMYNDAPIAMTIRHPSLWQMQLQTPNVWDRHTYSLWLKVTYGINLTDYISDYLNRDIVLTHPDIVLESKADCDGDLMPILVLDYEGQLLLRKFKLTQVTADERKWIKDYIDGEYESDLKLKLGGKHIYQLYQTVTFDTNIKNLKTYSFYLLNASVAKGNIGGATLDIWALTTILQCYQAYCEANNFTYSKNGKPVQQLTQKITQADIIYLNFIYTRLVQDRVIEGIKHIEEGSSSFKIYFLREISKDSNIKTVQHQLLKDYKVPSQYISKLLYVIKFADSSGLLQASRNFISLYNKGKQPINPEPLLQWEDFIQGNSYFGSLVKPIYDIRSKIGTMKTVNAEANQVQSQAALDALSSIQFNF